MITATVLARRSGVSLHTVRHYTRLGLLKPARHAGNGYKIYQPSDEARLRFITAVKDFGFSLAEIRQILDAAGRSEAACPQIKEMVSRRVVENSRRLKEMKRAQKQMEKAIGEWSSSEDAQPDGDALRRLVERVAEADKSDLTYDQATSCKVTNAGK
jgi:MerR family Zn(II)-responsive transcriptional regulator of zntA